MKYIYYLPIQYPIRPQVKNAFQIITIFKSCLKPVACMREGIMIFRTAAIGIKVCA